MITKFDIGDEVVVDNAFLAGKTRLDLVGTIISIHIFSDSERKYMIKFRYPKGSIIQGRDVSGEKVPYAIAYKENEIKGLNSTNLYFPGKGVIDEPES